MGLVQTVHMRGVLRRMARDAQNPEDVHAIQTALHDSDVFESLLETVGEEAAKPVAMKEGTPPTLKGSFIDVLNWLVANAPAILAFVKQIMALFGL